MITHQSLIWQKKQKNPYILQKTARGDLILMSIDAFEKREQILQLRAKVLQAEQECIDEMAALSVSQARKQLRERINDI